MSVYLGSGKKRVYWYRFMHRGQLIRKSTKQASRKAAVDMEAAHKTALAKGDAGIFEKKPAPTLAAFGKEFLVWAKATFSGKPKTLEYYRNGVNRLSEYQPLASLPLDSEELKKVLADYINPRVKHLEIGSVNRELQVLRRLMNLAEEWHRIESAPKIKLLPGENHREHVVQPAEEERYLLAAQKLIADVVAVLVDAALRPEELHRMVWDHVPWDTGKFGTFLVTHGKSKAARRVMPMTARVRRILEARWMEQERPVSGWVWPAPTKSGHMEPSTVKKQHKKALRLSKVRPFILYDLRHTCLTRWGASGMDPWMLARLAGHSSITMSMRYIHVQDDRVLAAVGGQEFGHSGEMTIPDVNRNKKLTA